MKKKIKFGLAIPTGTEGLMVNLPYASARDVVELSVFAEKIGLDSVWGSATRRRRSACARRSGCRRCPARPMRRTRCVCWS